jgi:hypothetical protein
MQSDIVTHIQDAVRPGESVDMYYSNQENSVKQAHATTVENRYFLDLNSKSFGSANTLIFNPDEGLGHIVLTLQLPAASGGVTYNGLALNAGWGYSAIRRVGVRIGGSTLYYFSGDQLMLEVLSDCEDSVKKQQMFNLGGSALKCTANGGGAGDFADQALRTAYVYIKCPWNTPSAQEKSLPLPTDLLTSPVQINIEFNSASDLFQTSGAVAGAAGLSDLPPAFALAQAQYEQTHFDDRGEQLARKVNMSEMAYSYGLKYFAQEVFRLQNVQGNNVTQSLTLTGLRSGNCLGIRLWCKDNASTDLEVYTVPSQVTLSVNGLIYFDSRNGQNQLWSLLDRKTSASWTADTITVNGTAFENNPAESFWTWMPFAQHSEVLANESELAHGLSLMNSIVNIQVALPNNTTYTVSAEYVFNSTLLFSRGSAEYVF